MKYTIKNVHPSYEGGVIYEEKIQKSLFIGHLKHITTPEEAKQFIHEINKLHSQANHNCPAYIIGKNGEVCFCSDAGEPAGTAGKPILNMLLRHELTNVIIVVTRYFGGIKLGVRGLIDAYGSIAEKTILSGEKTPVIDFFEYTCTMHYDYYDTFIHKIKIPDVEIVDTIYTDKIEIKLRVSEFSKNDFLRLSDECGNKVVCVGIS